ncbi:MAG TPA: helix-turn-helix domain-containing protein [Candidatus Anaerobutyricum stercoris]|uniref:Helix-turn-helix domain-containing protein n=1 Tax=Candidatus Anaerobutyricum stercoris TaxID=2838457 RepID=A0A9D2EMJ6_9FIRM|nr:helix-turn-helix domain-containing protein [Candidatus Anaerobutyricum stercoris]
MTIDEVSERYQIPAEILREYEGWGLCGADSVSWQCEKQDLERLSLIMVLHDVGFRKDEVEEYMRLVLEGETTRERRMRMLEERRVEALDEIHRREQKLEQLDYLRFRMQKEQKEQSERRPSDPK